MRLLIDRFRRPILCSFCFKDSGLALEASKIGRASPSKCPHCKARGGAKLNPEEVEQLMRIFFIYGSYLKTEFGGATLLKFGDGEVRFPHWLEEDVRLLEDQTGSSFRYNGPRTYLIGEVYPLDELKSEETRERAAESVVKRFPRRSIGKGETFYPI